MPIQTFNYGIHHNQLIIHAIGKLWLADNRQVLQKMVDDPRVKPGMLITVLGASEVLYTPAEADELVGYLAATKPKAVTAIVYLDDMFDYIMEKKLT
jgi:hypothetical protein